VLHIYSYLLQYLVEIMRQEGREDGLICRIISDGTPNSVISSFLTSVIR
jgi:hypothetical protein